MTVIFSAVFFMPLGSECFMTAINAMLDLSKWYAQEHIVMCLLPAFFHCRSYSGIRQSGGRDEILRGECEKVVVLYGCRCVRGYIGRVFLYDTSAVYEHLQNAAQG